MEWVREFYEKQYTWAGQEDITPGDRERALVVDRILDGKGAAILELGSGGGQTASALADLGYTVVAVDLNPRAVEHARGLAECRDDDRLTVILGDFFEVELSESFDAVCYFDGFGVGEDEDQHRLLKRIAGWLNPDGRALIEVYTPWYWSRAAGQVMQWGNVSRRYDFDADGSRMLDTWWSTSRPDETVTQSLRCYSPEDLGLLAKGSGLAIAGIQPGGAMDYEKGIYHGQVPLEEAMSYLAIFRRSAGQNAQSS